MGWMEGNTQCIHTLPTFVGLSWSAVFLSALFLCEIVMLYNTYLSCSGKKDACGIALLLLFGLVP